MSQFGPTPIPLKRVRRRGRRVLVCDEGDFGDLKSLSRECCPTACCLPDGTCRHLFFEDCLALGGAPFPPNNTCSDVDCSITQACCFEDGSCVDVPPDECVALGGTPQGEDTDCVDTNCVPLPCPDSCDNCPSTVTITALGFGFTICSESYDDCPDNCLTINHDYTREAILVPEFCQWNIPAPSADVYKNCLDEDLIRVLISNGSVHCHPQTMQWHVRLFMSISNFGPTIASVIWHCMLLNTTDCPMGTYVVENIVPNDPSNVITSITSGTLSVQ